MENKYEIFAIGSDGENVIRYYNLSLEQAEEIKRKLESFGFSKVMIL